MKAALAVACLFVIGCSKPQPAKPVAVESTSGSPAKPVPDPLVVAFRKKFDAFEEEARSAFNLASLALDQRTFAAKQEVVDDLLSRIPDAPHGRQEFAEILSGCKRVGGKVGMIQAYLRLAEESIRVGNDAGGTECKEKAEEWAAEGKAMLAETKKKLDELSP